MLPSAPAVLAGPTSPAAPFNFAKIRHAGHRRTAPSNNPRKTVAKNSGPLSCPVLNAPAIPADTLSAGRAHKTAHAPRQRLAQAGAGSPRQVGVPRCRASLDFFSSFTGSPQALPAANPALPDAATRRVAGRAVALRATAANHPTRRQQSALFMPPSGGFGGHGQEKRGSARVETRARMRNPTHHPLGTPAGFRVCRLLARGAARTHTPNPAPDGGQIPPRQLGCSGRTPYGHCNRSSCLPWQNVAASQTGRARRPDLTPRACQAACRFMEGRFRSAPPRSAMCRLCSGPGIRFAGY